MGSMLNFLADFGLFESLFSVFPESVLFFDLLFFLVTSTGCGNRRTRFFCVASASPESLDCDTSTWSDVGFPSLPLFGGAKCFLDDRDVVSVGCGKKRRAFSVPFDMVLWSSLRLWSLSLGVRVSATIVDDEPCEVLLCLSNSGASCGLLDRVDVSTSSGLNLRTLPEW